MIHESAGCLLQYEQPMADPIENSSLSLSYVSPCCNSDNVQINDELSTGEVSIPDVSFSEFLELPKPVKIDRVNHETKKISKNDTSR